MPYKDLIARREYARKYATTSPRAKEGRRRYYRKHRSKLLRTQQLLYTERTEKVLYNRKRRLIANIKHRASKLGIEFNLTVDNLDWPIHCPILGIEIDYFSNIKTRESGPSIDRFNPAKGYTKENCAVISYRANMLKNNATIKELKAVIKYLKSRSN